MASFSIYRLSGGAIQGILRGSARFPFSRDLR
jgi:hypothetical protein